MKQIKWDHLCLIAECLPGHSGTWLEVLIPKSLRHCLKESSVSWEKNNLIFHLCNANCLGFDYSRLIDCQTRLLSSGSVCKFACQMRQREEESRNRPYFQMREALWGLGRQGVKWAGGREWGGGGRLYTQMCWTASFKAFDLPSAAQKPETEMRTIKRKALRLFFCNENSWGKQT